MARNKMTGKFILGAVLGAVGAILFAPKSGKETREELKSKAQETSDKANKKYAEVKTKALEVETEVRARGAELADKAKDVGEKVKEAFHSEEAQEGAKSAKQLTAQAVKDVKKTVRRKPKT